jgi:hypothetical protein
MSDRSRRRGAAILLATIAASVLFTILPGLALACSCAMPGSMAESAKDPNTVIFTGTILPSGRPAVDVAVGTWFKGGSGALTTLASDGFNDEGGGADCRVPYPVVGSSWIFVAYVDPATGPQPHTNLCSPQANLDTPEGQVMLADAVAVFGTPPSPSPAPVAAPPGPLETVGQAMGGVAPIVAVVAIAGIVFAGLAVVLRRRDGEG